MLTTFVFLQLFALYLKRQRLPATEEQPSKIESLQAILFYGLIATGYMLNSLTREISGTVTDPAGVVWRVQDIYTASGLVAICTMGTFTMLGLVKLLAVSPAVPNVSVETAPIATVPYSPERQIN